MVGTHVAGVHLFEILVRSNDPMEPVKKLYLKADFSPENNNSGPKLQR